MVTAEPLPDAHHPEPGPLVQAQAGGVLGEDPGLDGPDPGRLGGADQGAEQGAPDPAPAGRGGDVHRVLDHPLVDAPVRDRHGGGPAQHLPARVIDRDVAVAGQPGGVEYLPGGRVGLEAGLTAVQAGLVDGEHLAGVGARHGADGHSSRIHR